MGNESDTEERRSAKEFKEALMRGEVDMSEYDSNTIPPEVKYAHFYEDATGMIRISVKPKELSRDNMELDKGEPIAEYEFEEWIAPMDAHFKLGELKDEFGDWSGFVIEECESVDLD